MVEITLNNYRGGGAGGRTTQTVEEVGTGHLARTTNFTYALDNQIATLQAVNATTGNQTTTYTYGTTLASSGVARNDLLISTAYPDTGLAWSSLGVDDWANLTVDQWAELPVNVDITQATYNRLGQRITFTDQRGTVRAFYYDKLGRQTNDCVSAVGDDTDDAVLQIAAAYEIRGMASTITSTDSATAGSGTVLNQVQRTYNTFGQLTKEQQSHSGAVGGSTPSVQYAYDSGGSSSNEIRLNQLTCPNGRAVSYNYASGMDSTLNRVTSISDSSATLAGYIYLGAGKVVRITYPQPSVWLDLWGGTSGVFNGLDQFNRIIDQRWQNSVTGTPVDIDRYKYGYDQDSNRQWKQNAVSSAASVPLDEYYTYDNLDRLTEMQRGTLTGGPPFTGISGTPVAEQDWTLDPTGNWSAFLTKASGTTTLNQTRTQNRVNEITAIGGTPAWATPPAYDAAGNMTSFPQPASPSSNFTATYDAWNQMTSISSGGNLVAQYQYDGRGRRIVKQSYVGSSILISTRHFYYSNTWQDLEERVDGSTIANFQYVWGLRYVDELVCRDYLSTTGGSSGSSGPSGSSGSSASSASSGSSSSSGKEKGTLIIDGFGVSR
jgi:YD repeat-containing protein